MSGKRSVIAVALLLVLLIGLFPVGTASAYSPDYDTVRVGINGYHCWSVTPYVSLHNSGGLRLGSYDGNRQFTASGQVYYNLRITGSGSSLTVTNGAGETVYTGSSVAIAPVNSSITTTYALPSASYGDNSSSSFEFYGGFVATSSSSSLTVVNYVDLERYVQGVVPYEAIASWPLETLKAQALAARTYVVSNFGQYSSYGYDVTNTTYSQVYKGTASANTNTNLAVTETAGEYILYNGSPISAVYHSCDGGATENVANVWGSSTAYLTGTTDNYEVTPSNVGWSRTYTPEELYSYMKGRDSGFNLANIADVSCTYTDLGNMYSVTFTDSNGTTKTYSKEQCHTVVLEGFTFNSQRFTITKNVSAQSAGADLGEELPEDEANAVRIEQYATEAVSTPVEAEDDTLHIYNSELEIIAMDEAGLLDRAEEEPAMVSTYASGTTYTIQNYGYGHNLGMSQYGAKSMADQGMTYDQIIHFYYDGVTINGVAGENGGGGNGGGTTTGYTDVSSSNWYYDAVQYVSEQGLMTGTASRTFSPNASTTRGMFVTILGRMAGVDESAYALTGTITGSEVNFRSGPGTGYGTLGTFSRGQTVTILGKSGNWYQVSSGGRTGYVSADYVSPGSGTYSDVAAGQYYTAYVEWAGAKGIVAGFGDGTFKPNQVMTREEMCTFLNRYCTVMGVSLETQTTQDFSDFSSVSSWAQESVRAMQRAGIVEGTGNNKFEPKSSSNRASVAQMIANFHEKYC